MSEDISRDQQPLTIELCTSIKQSSVIDTLKDYFNKNPSVLGDIVQKSITTEQLDKNLETTIKALVISGTLAGTIDIKLSKVIDELNIEKMVEDYVDDVCSSKDIDGKVEEEVEEQVGNVIVDRDISDKMEELVEQKVDEKITDSDIRDKLTEYDFDGKVEEKISRELESYNYELTVSDIIKKILTPEYVSATLKEVIRENQEKSIPKETLNLEQVNLFVSVKKDDLDFITKLFNIMGIKYEQRNS